MFFPFSLFVERFNTFESLTTIDVCYTTSPEIFYLQQDKQNKKKKIGYLYLLEAAVYIIRMVLTSTDINYIPFVLFQSTAQNIYSS